jgi:hypothetical protein
VRREASSWGDYEKFVKSISEYIKPHATILGLGSPSPRWGFIELRPDVTYLSEVFLTPAWGVKEASRIEYVVMARSFDPAADEAWHRREARKIGAALAPAGKALLKVGDVGTKRRFAFSAQIFQVVKER